MELKTVTQSTGEITKILMFATCHLDKIEKLAAEKEYLKASKYAATY